MLRRLPPFLPLLLAVELSAQAAPLASRPEPPPSTCAPPGHDRATLLALRSQRFAVTDDARRNALAIALVECLGDADPLIRDGVAYEGLTRFMRDRQLTTATLIEIRPRLLAQLEGPEGDGFVRPFAALGLAELVRNDRLDPYMGATDRQRLLDAAIAYVQGITDYRVFDEHEGYRHGVAHGADLLMQLARHPQVDAPDLRRILDAVASQLFPPGHVYDGGEGDRLARPVLAVAERDALTESQWTEWLSHATAPARASANGSPQRLNAAAFLTPLHRAVTGEASTPYAPLRPAVDAARRELHE